MGVALGNATSFLALTAIRAAVVYVGLNAVTTVHLRHDPQELLRGRALGRRRAPRQVGALLGTVVGVGAGGGLAPDERLGAVRRLLRSPSR